MRAASKVKAERLPPAGGYPTPSDRNGPFAVGRLWVASDVS